MQEQSVNNSNNDIKVKKVLKQLLDCLNKVPIDEELLPVMYDILNRIKNKTHGLVNLDDLATKTELELIGIEVVETRNELLRVIELDFHKEFIQIETCINKLRADIRWELVQKPLLDELEIYKFTYEKPTMGFDLLFFGFAKAYLPSQIENLGYFGDYMLKTTVDKKYKFFCFHSIKYQLYSNNTNLFFLPYNTCQSIKTYFCGQ